MDIYKLIEAGNRHREKKLWTVDDLATMYPGESRANFSTFMRRSTGKGVLRALVEEGRTTAWFFADRPPDVFEAALFLDAGAVVSGLSALSRHGITTQPCPRAVCVTRSRRGGQAHRGIVTTVGEVAFHYQRDRIMDLEPAGAHPETRLASPEKALLDHVYIHRNRHHGRSPDILELDFEALDLDRLDRYRLCYPKTVWRAILDARAEADADLSRGIFGR